MYRVKEEAEQSEEPDPKRLRVVSLLNDRTTSDHSDDKCVSFLVPEFYETKELGPIKGPPIHSAILSVNSLLNKPEDRKAEIPKIHPSNDPNSEEEIYKKFNPYNKLINRSRRVRKGKVIATKNPGRACGWCGCQTTPEWRNGPENITLCNACGLQYRNQLKMEQEDKRKNSIKNLLN